MTAFIIFLCLASIIVLVLVARDVYISWRLQLLIIAKYTAMKGIIDQITSSSTISEKEIRAIAIVPSLRIALYRALEAYGRQGLFPDDLYTEERGAESYLVNWLEFPTELGKSPDEILLMKVVTMDLHLRIHYYVFKFRTAAPRWAKKFGWMIGVCGPYDDASLPFDIPNKIFSRFNTVNITTPDAEVRWTHGTINSGRKSRSG